MTLHLFFYGAGWLLDFSGVALLLLMLMECVTEGAFSFFRLTAGWLVFVFLAAASIHTCGWLLEITGMLKAEDAYEHYKFLSARVAFWLELGAVFAPLLLWVPAAREQPGIVLVVSAVTVASWVGALAGYVLGIRF
jgi:hypothetical protein